MNLFKTLKKIWRGDNLDWHRPFPPALQADEMITTCAICGRGFVITKSERRIVDYCWECK